MRRQILQPASVVVVVRCIPVKGGKAAGVKGNSCGAEGGTERALRPSTRQPIDKQLVGMTHHRRSAPSPLESRESG